MRSSLSTWLHRIAVNVSLAKRRKATPVEALPEDDGEAAAGEWLLETPVEVEEIETAIAGCRTARAMRWCCTPSTVIRTARRPQMLGIAEGTCKAQLHRARATAARATRCGGQLT